MSMEDTVHCWTFLQFPVSLSKCKLSFLVLREGDLSLRVCVCSCIKLKWITEKKNSSAGACTSYCNMMGTFREGMKWKSRHKVWGIIKREIKGWGRGGERNRQDWEAEHVQCATNRSGNQKKIISVMMLLLMMNTNHLDHSYRRSLNNM